MSKCVDGFPTLSKGVNAVVDGVAAGGIVPVGTAAVDAAAGIAF